MKGQGGKWSGNQQSFGVCQDLKTVFHLYFIKLTTLRPVDAASRSPKFHKDAQKAISSYVCFPLGKLKRLLLCIGHQSSETLLHSNTRDIYRLSLKLKLQFLWNNLPTCLRVSEIVQPFLHCLKNTFFYNSHSPLMLMIMALCT